MGLICGFGINDADYVTQPSINGKCVARPEYRAWKGMIVRSYSSKNNAAQPTYIGVTVCDEWRSFMAFRGWWLDNHVDGWHLDKDILTDKRVYSPDTCIYVPSWLNGFIIDCGASRGEWPIGVRFHNRARKFDARCRNPMTGKSEFLGYFSDPASANNAWLVRKLSIAKELRLKMDEIDSRIYPRVVEIIERAK